MGSEYFMTERGCVFGPICVVRVMGKFHFSKNIILALMVDIYSMFAFIPYFLGCERPMVGFVF